MIPDPCCQLCRTPHGICRASYGCSHHIEAQAQDDANHRARTTVPRPTEDAAINNIMRARRKGKP